MSVVGQVMVLFLLMLCGLLAAKARWIKEEGIQGLNQVLVNFSLPSLIVGKLQRDAAPGLMPQLFSVFWMAGASILLCGLIGWLVFWREQPARRAVFTGMVMFSNAGFMGFPVLMAAYGEENLIYGVIYVAIFNVLCWSVGILLFDRKALSAKKILAIPSLTASILGIVLFAAGIRLPAMIREALELMGGTTTPLAMFIVGTRLSRLQASDLKDWKLLLACGLRLAVLPALVYFLTGLAGASGMVRTAVTLCTAMPCAAVQVIQAETYHGDAALASRGVALSTALSVVTIPLMLMLL